MAVDSNTSLETHPTGTTNVVGIVNANWQALIAIFNPALASADSRFQLIWKALCRAGTLPTKPARPEYVIGSPSKATARLVHDSLTYGATLTLDSAGPVNQSVTLTGDVTIAFNSISEGREITLIMEASGSTRNITWPASIRWVAGTAPASLAAGKILRVNFLMRTGAESGIIATHFVEP